jgi:pristinamycin I synthase-3/4
LNTHGSLANYLAFLIVEFGLGPHDVVLQLVSPSFDPVIREVMGPLSAGASLLLTGTAGVPEPALALRLLAGRRVSCLLAVVPTYLRALLESAAGGVYLPALRLLLTTGEPLRPADVREAQRRLGAQVEVVNQYGPAECTQTTSFYRAGLANSGGSVPIGGPIRNAYWRLLDERLWPVPAGETGELFIGGAGVSRGYAGRPDWTAERFVPDPYSAIAGARLYRTGDLARARAGGNLEFVGRVDLQIKLRGNRVEPAEIEARLTAHPAVQSAAVVLRADARGEARLAAYWVSRPGAAVGRGDLRSWLAYSLPDYMLPSTYIQVRALPLTASGKVDRLALPAPNGARPLDPASYVAPLTPVEACLAEIWSDVLRLDQVGIYDSFFELGGHSLHAMQVVARINQTWAVDLSVRVLFDAPVIAALAVAVTQQLAGRVPEAELTRLLVELRVATRGRRTP